MTNQRTDVFLKEYFLKVIKTHIIIFNDNQLFSCVKLNQGDNRRNYNN